jgi:hypothetical protein
MENTASDFTIDIARDCPMQLDETWEVGLSEIIFPSLIYNLTETMLQDIFVLSENSRRIDQALIHVENPPDNVKIDSNLVPGFYTPNDFVHYFNQFVKDDNEYMNKRRHLFSTKFSFNEASKKFFIKIGGQEKIHINNKRMKFMLGLPTEGYEKYLENTEMNKKIISFPNIADFYANIRTIFIYCDLVRRSQVGDVFAPILRIISLKNSKNDSMTLHYDFRSPQYFPLATPMNINSIRIQMTDASGDKIVFPNGNTIAVLHFRKKDFKIT